MPGSEEIEIKVWIHDLDALVAKLEACGFHCHTPRTHEMNTLHDTPDRALRARGQLLRVRRYGDRWIVTHKAKRAGDGAGRHKVRVETETAVEDGETLAEIFTALGYGPVFRYEKFRAEWTDGTGHVVIDETPIGDIAEIEGPPEWIDRTATRLGIRESEYLNTNYAAMFEEWKKKTGSTAHDMTFEAVAPM